MWASQSYLEAIAKKYLYEAEVSEKAGNYIDAAKNYRKAAEILQRLVLNQKDSPMASIYKQLIDGYLKKAQQLEEMGKSIVGYGVDEKSNAVHAEPAAQQSDKNFADVENLIVREKPSVRFEDIIGLEEAKQAVIESIVYPTRRPDLFPPELGWPRGILLYGPPGCGKTMLAAAVANEIDGVFIQIDAASIMSKWLGDAEKKVARIFAYARWVNESEKKPVIMFIDEVDALMGVYDHEIGGEVRVKNQFLKEMDGLQDKGKNYLIFVLAATNKPWRLDIGFIRRFQKRIYIPPPDKEMRKRAFQHYLSRFKISADIDFDKLAELTEGYSFSDIKEVVLDAYMATVREIFKRGSVTDKPREIAMQDLLNALSRRKPSISKQLLDLYHEWASKFGAV